MVKFYAVAVVASTLTAVAQVLLKMGATRGAGRELKALYLNPFSLSGYSLMGLVTLMNLYAFKIVPIKAQVFFMGFVLLLVTGLSFRLLGESLSRKEMAGAAMILAGLAIYGL